MGCFPKFIEMTRDRRILKEGKTADINILDWGRVRDNTTIRPGLVI
jgi:N-acyl-D-aspartate/D-glutamate deacylase